MNKMYCLEVKGDFACFTRPETKVERFSYDVITPSAARSIFEAIFWKPAIRWEIVKIEVLNPIAWVSIRRNEVGRIFAKPTAQHLAGILTEPLGFYIEDERQQRAGLFLRDVKYRLYANLTFIQKYDPEASYEKYSAMFERRALKGQCFNQPYLGCREFSCAFRLINDSAEEPAPIENTSSLGWMLYDMDYNNIKEPIPRFFEAKMQAGVITVPHWNSEEVRK